MRSINNDWDPLPSDPKQPPPTDPANPTAPIPLRVDVHSGTIADDEWVYFKVEDEICLGQWNAAAGKFDTVYRGLFNTNVVTHEAGAEWREVAVIAPQEVDGPLETRYTKFTGGNTPEHILLSLLIGGAPQANASLDYYRTMLPDGWGLGFDPNRIDEASFMAAITVHHSNTIIGGIVTEPVVFSEWAKENILRPYGLYLVARSDDTLYLGLNQTGNYEKYIPSAGPHAGLGVRAIDSGDVIGVPQWRGAIDRVVGAMQMEGDTALGGQPEAVKVEVFTDAVRAYAGSWRTLSYRSDFLFSSNRMNGAVPTSDGRLAGMHAVYGRLRDYLQVRWTKVPGIASVRTRFSCLDVELGMTVQVNLPTVPNLQTAGYGGLQYAQVVGRKVNDDAGTIDFELAVYPHQMLGVANWGACAYIFSATGGVGTCNGRFYPVGPAYEAAHFEVGDVVDVLSCRSFTPVALATTITARDLNNATITASGIVADTIVVPSGYAGCTASQKAKGPYMAGTDGILPTGQAPWRWSSR